MAANIQTNATSITEQDFFQMLLETSPLRHSDTLANAAKRASSQRLTCEKAAYLALLYAYMGNDRH